MISSLYVFVDNDVDKPPTVVGRYELNEVGAGRFYYGKSWLAHPQGFPLDPINLPLQERVFESTMSHGEFGVLWDASPDQWGRRLLAATHRQIPKNAVEWLLATSGGGAGCLLFSGARSMSKPRRSPYHLNEIYSFVDIYEHLDKVTPAAVPQDILRLLDYGASMGGAKPKTLIQHQEHEWIAKLNRQGGGDIDTVRVEFASNAIARRCGIDTPDVQLHEMGAHSMILVKRFDRTIHGRRHHYISAHSLFNRGKISELDYQERYSYMALADIVRRISATPERDCEQLFRRMVFNVIIGNTDDHARNHGFLLTDPGRASFELAPAFDISPQPHNAGLQALGIGKEGRLSTLENAMSAHPRFLLSQHQAKAVVQDIQDACASSSLELFREAGLSRQNIKILLNTFRFKPRLRAIPNPIHRT